MGMKTGYHDNREGSMLLREDVVQKKSNRNARLCEAEHADWISRSHASALHASPMPISIGARPPKGKMFAGAQVFSEGKTRSAEAWIRLIQSACSASQRRGSGFLCHLLLPIVPGNARLALCFSPYLNGIDRKGLSLRGASHRRKSCARAVAYWLTIATWVMRRPSRWRTSKR